jgi:ankyrin repeat protein
MLALMMVLGAGSLDARPPVFGPKTATIETALAKGADPNQLSGGWRPLNYNVAFSHPSNNKKKGVSYEDWLNNVKLLLKAGADPNGLALGDSALKMTPLAWGVRQCRADIVRVLLEYGAEPLGPCYRSQDDLGTHLIAMVAPGMDPFAPSVDAERELALALLDYIEKKHGRQVLLDYVRIDPPGAQIPALHGAVVRGYYGVLAALIEKRVDLDQKISIPSLQREWTALHLAEGLGRLDFADALRRAGARDDVLSNAGESPAAVRGSLMMGSAASELATMALQIAQKDWIGFFKDAERDTVWKMSVASGRRGVRKPPDGWTGFDDAIRKAQEASAKAN